MAYDKRQFESLITRVLKEITLYSPEAVQLLLGTAAKESNFGTYLRQLGEGPALGAFQMEPETFEDLRNRFGARFPLIRAFSVLQLEWDLRVAIIMVRLKYFSCPGPLPLDLHGQAEYWKRYYNTEMGAGTVEEYLAAYRKYVG